ncbi:type II toxin-antitoxin system prevent-host-death family antitoxin [soil metagenome]
MKQVNIHEAKTQLSRLIDRVSAGTEVVIAKAGKPVARLVPVLEQHPARVKGSLKGKLFLSDDFDAPLPDEILAAFEGRSTK